MSFIVERCREVLEQYHGQQRARWPRDPVNADLFERITEVLRKFTIAAKDGKPDPTSESVYLALADEIDGKGKSQPAPAAGDDKTIWYHGGQSYSIQGQDPINVSPTEHYGLQAFLDSHVALDTKALEKKMVSNPSSTFGKLAKKFPGAIRLPERKGDGYFARVKQR